MRVFNGKVSHFHRQKRSNNLYPFNLDSGQLQIIPPSVTVSVGWSTKPLPQIYKSRAVKIQLMEYANSFFNISACLSDAPLIPESLYLFCPGSAHFVALQRELTVIYLQGPTES